MHILFIGYGKTSQRVAQYLFEQDVTESDQITTISRSPKRDVFAQHLSQDVHSLQLDHLAPIDLVYIVLAPSQSGIAQYQRTYLDSIEPIARALKAHPVQRIIVVSSTRVYGEHQGEKIDDDSGIQPSDEQGQILRGMELKWQALYPEQTVIIRPSGIYGTSVARLIKLAKDTQYYPDIHYSNRIHIHDLARFLAYLAHAKQVSPSYIVSNNHPLPLHELIVWFQQQLQLPLLQLNSHKLSGKQLYATRMMQTGFQLQHPICFNDYLMCLKQHSQSE
ncbi:SDR family NAD(P)-dependent oxidoreductase [Acinetobacter ihumii]|uniref:SDR family NAD(P)-dependent oxidoreductase n=1 Tax=Acinetobacter ihumii TaxID=2483802 RepID=UPI00102F3234|nr:SDR family NAD(P)-dependent oxidoreductase [Acinetobacter ihumii]